MIELLLLWPLLPLVGTLGPLRWLPSGIWVGIAAGGAGWALDGAFGGVPAGPWASTGAALAVSSFYAYLNGRSERQVHAEMDSAVSRLEKEASALEKERSALRQEVERYEREDTHAFQVYSLAKSLTETVSWNSLVNRFAQVMQKVTGSSDFLLYLSSDAGLELQVQNGSLTKEIVPALPPSAHPQWVPSGRETFLQVPLWQTHAGGDGQGTPSEEKELLGLLWVRWATANHPPVSEIESIFEHLLIGFQKAKLFAHMESLSRIDGLTGVLRRQAFLDDVQAEWNRARQFKTTFSFLLVDVDHFKRINDKYGHPGGDAVLARLGELLRQGIYETDHVGRYGGEEFGLLMSRSDPEGVRRKAETLRTRIAGESFSVGFEKIPVTISVGIAHFPRDGGTVSEVLDAADKALYAAKHAGRNRVVDIGEAR